MNRKSDSPSNTAIFKEQTISFADISGQAKFFVDYQKNKSNLERFYPTKNTSLEEQTKKVLANYKLDRNRLCDVLTAENERYGSTEKTFQKIEQLRDDDCVAVLTGQQAGLFSGPVYSIYKALSAIKMAKTLSNKGIKAVPIFWIASEDHDFDEISSTFFIDENDEGFGVQNSPSDLIEDTPVGFTRIEPNIKDAIEKLANKLSKTEYTEEIIELLNQTYKSEVSFSDAFGKLIAKIFDKFGLILVSPLNKDLRKFCSPIYKNAIENFQTINEKLLARNTELRNNNYHSQVLVEEGFFPFFYIDKDNKRKALRRDSNSNKVKSQDTTIEFTKDELVEIADKSPEMLSPNALMRPIVQDYLFPTVCYFGGGAEIAYFGQNSVIYETLNRPITPIRHRASFSIIEGKHRRTLQKYDLEFKDLLLGKEELLAGIIEKYINTPTAKTFSETEDFFNKQLKILDDYLRVDDPTLSDNLDNRKKKILWHISTLRKKFHKSELIKNEVLERRISSLLTTVLPKGTLQERNLNLLHFINIYGENFVEWIYNAVDTNETEHQIVIF